VIDMADPFLGEIRPFPFGFAPRGWSLCHGQLLPIAQNTALFSLLGTQFGGDGKTTFGLPNLQGATPIGQGQGAGLSPFKVGDSGGVETETLQASEMAAHGHGLPASTATATATTPAANMVPAQGQGGGRGNSFAINTYTTAPPETTLAPATVAPTGGGGPHNNMQPSLVVNWCIAVNGVFPSRS
jgi:microcystin-dependent protein